MHDTSATLRIANLLSLFLARLSRPTPLESGVLEKTCAMLDEPEGRILRLQVQLAAIQRHLSGRTIEFRYRKRPPSIRRLANCQGIHRAVLAVRGSVSGFSTVATVRLAKGVLCSLDFDPIPWAVQEPLDIEGKFTDFVEPAADGSVSDHGELPMWDRSVMNAMLRRPSAAISPFLAASTGPRGETLRDQFRDRHAQRLRDQNHLMVGDFAEHPLDLGNARPADVEALELALPGKIRLGPAFRHPDGTHLETDDVLGAFVAHENGKPIFPIRLIGSHLCAKRFPETIDLPGFAC